MTYINRQSDRMLTNKMNAECKEFKSKVAKSVSKSNSPKKLNTDRGWVG